MSLIIWRAEFCHVQNCADLAAKRPTTVTQFPGVSAHTIVHFFSASTRLITLHRRLDRMQRWLSFFISNGQASNGAVREFFYVCADLINHIPYRLFKKKWQMRLVEEIGRATENGWVLIESDAQQISHLSRRDLPRFCLIANRAADFSLRPQKHPVLLTVTSEPRIA